MTVTTESRNVVTNLVRAATAACAMVALTGCLQMQGVHQVNPHGDSDGGGYAITLDTPTYLAMLVDNPNALDSLKRYSRPRTQHQDGKTTISDLSGNAGMEHAYDEFECRPAAGAPGWSDCSFAYRKNGLTFPGWSVDWAVVLRPEMVVLSSNHHRSSVKNGARILRWQFDGNRLNEFDISFTVRVPKA